jgi:uncharacterized protein YlxW (UPF0749 family)
MKKQLKVYFLLISFFIGFIVTIQLKNNIPAYQGILTIPKILEMKNEVENAKKESLNLANAINEAQFKLKDYEKSIEETGSIYNSMKEQVANARVNADYEALEGPGIIITLNDSITAVGQGENPAWYVIHDADILEVINKLRGAGAEAISLNDERVIATSNIRCGGPTINIDGKRHAVPFVIKAIGDPQRLEASATAPGGYIDLMEVYDIRINIQKVERMTIEAYDGRYKLNYQKKIEDGE